MTTFLLRNMGGRIYRAAVTTTGDGQFRHYQRNPYQQYEADIHQHEGTAAIFTSDIGKTPEIAQSDRAANGSKQESGLGGP